MSWYNTQGSCQEFVLFSKAKYIRNIAKQSFCPLIDAKRGAETFSKLESILQKNGFRGEKAPAGVTPHMLSLAEKQLIERDLVYSERSRALYLNEPCNLLVSLGGDNYITISSVISGLQINEARNMASEAEELIDREIAFAYLEGIGYLSPDPYECGSGLCFSSALYLPSLRLSDGQDAMLSSLFSKGMSLTPMLASKENSGDLYILTYSPHYLCDEESAAEFFKEAILQITEGERSKLCIITKNKEKTIHQRARRALGELLYSDVLNEAEMLTLLSEIRLCRCVCDKDADDLPNITTVNYLCAEGLNYSVIASSKEKCNSEEELCRARAILVKGYIEHKNEVAHVK